MAFTIRVNGAEHSVDVDGDTPLLWGAGLNRYEARLWHGPLWRMHGASERRPNPLLRYAG
jgi:hypothetical protein